MFIGSVSARRAARACPDYCGAMRSAKIVCTLGPATSSYDQIKQLIESGMNVARLNMSHGEHAIHAESYATVRRAATSVCGACARTVTRQRSSLTVRPTLMYQLSPNTLCMILDFLMVGHG